MIRLYAFRMRNGVLYVLYGTKTDADAAILFELKQSVASLKKRNPGLPVMVFTNYDPQELNVTDCDVREIPPLPDGIRNLPHPMIGYAAKVWGLAQSPFTNTLFLDCDTYVCGDLSHILTEPGPCDFAIARVPKVAWKQKPPVFEDLERIGTFNTGVILLTKNQGASTLMNVWLRECEKMIKTDQELFNRLIHKPELNEVRMRILSNLEYNARTNFWPVANKVTQDLSCLKNLKILHSHSYGRACRTNFFKYVDSLIDTGSVGAKDFSNADSSFLETDVALI